MHKEFGAFADGYQRPHSRKTLVAKDYASFLSEITTLAGPEEMRAAMGATKSAFASLERDGILVPHTHSPKIIARWRIADGIALVEGLAALAVRAPTEKEGWETTQQARRRKRIEVGTQINLVRSGALKFTRIDSSAGYGGFLVPKAELDVLTAGATKSISVAPELSGTVSAAAFGRSIGIRDGGHFLALIEAGHAPSTEIFNPHISKSQASDEQRRHRRIPSKIMTLTTMEPEFGLHKNKVSAALKAHRAAPSAPDGKILGLIWLREVVGLIFV